ncbi:Cell wall mannoprotein 1 [Colletotrichum sidae]|uniref:Cell wall mannoprotein 1 n=1 Tax=Colletotrichum sidae TaxID=1347389 RepID=A0A4R8TBF2_9PEZI|nr:Cell wall mannoprotein 1 [Colletotrichum sidae]
MLFRSLFSSFTLTLLAAAPVLAAPVSLPEAKHKRDLKTIQTALNTINQALKGLDNSVKATTQITLGSGFQLLNAIATVRNSIEDATTQVQASEVLNRPDARNLKAATDALTNNVKVTINDVVDKKSLVDSLGATPLVAVALQDQKSVSVALANALVSKVPPELNADAQQSANALSTVLDAGIAIFAGTAPAPAPAPVQAAEVAAGAAGTCSAAAAQAAAPAASAAGNAARGAAGFFGGLMGMFGR